MLKNFSNFFKILLVLLLALMMIGYWKTYIFQAFSAPPYPSYKEYGHLYVYVTDSCGRLLLDVRLYVYKGDSLIILQKINGSIVLRLLEGSYKIKVEKEGYTVFSENVYIAKNKCLTLKVILKPAIEIAGSIPLNLTLQGYQEKRLELEVHNNGNWEEEVKLLIMLQDPQLIIPVIQVDDKQIVNNSIIRIDPKSSIDLVLKLLSLNNCGKTHIAIVLEYRGIRISRNFTITVTKCPLRLFKTSVRSINASPGKELLLTLYLSNPTWLSETFILRCKAPAGWIANLSYNDNEVGEIFLEPTSNVELKLKISIPFDIPNGVYRIVLNAEGKTTNMSETMVLEINIKDTVNPLYIKLEKAYLDVSAGSIAKYPVIILNRYSRNLLLNFSVKDLPSNYLFWIEDESGNRLSSIYIRSEEEIRIYICVRTPEEASVGTFNFRFIVSSNNRENSVNLYLSVIGKYDIDIVNENFLLEVYSGEEAIYDLKVKNTGSLELTNITFQVVECPQVVNVTVMPEEIMMLKPGETRSFKLIVKTEGPAGDYYLLFRVKTDQFSTITYGLRISVRQREINIFIAISIVLIILIILVVVYKKYGRR